MNCENCKFWKLFSSDVEREADIGTCERYPPVFAASHNIEDGEQHSDPGYWAQPATYADTTCGEHQPKKAASA